MTVNTYSVETTGLAHGVRLMGSFKPVWGDHCQSAPSGSREAMSCTLSSRQRKIVSGPSMPASIGITLILIVSKWTQELSPLVTRRTYWIVSSAVTIGPESVESFNPAAGDQAYVELVKKISSASFNTVPAQTVVSLAIRAGMSQVSASIR